MQLRDPLSGRVRKPALRKAAILGLAAVVTLALAGRTSGGPDTSTPDESAFSSDYGRTNSGEIAESRDSVQSKMRIASGAPVPATDVVGPDKVQEATLTLEVDKGTFDDQFARVGALAKRHRAEITTSSSQSFDDEHRGSIELRVPVSELGALSAELHGLGDVTAESTNTYDNGMAGRQIDHQIGEIQRQIDRVQAEIAKTTDPRLLDNLRSELADLQLQLDLAVANKAEIVDTEARATLWVDISEDMSVATPTQLARDWDRATTAALSVLGAVVIGLGYGLPTAVLFVLALLVLRVARRRPAVVSTVDVTPAAV